MFGVGSVISGKYRVLRVLGEGGMGSVYEAEHLSLGTRVAVKVLHPELARRPGLVERLLREARVAAQIRGPHVVQVFDVDRTPEGDAYIVMELLQGEPLSSLLDRQRTLPVPVACEYTVQVLEALEAAHALGVIHRDLKPDNVFVTPSVGGPVLKLIDFGIAKARVTDPQQKALTVAGSIMGTVEYMAPEQARSAGEVDARADIYAVGVMLYEMIAGSRPVTGDDPQVVALRVERGDVVPLLKAAPATPATVDAIVTRAMAARPELRFATAAEMRAALENATGNVRSPVAVHAPATVTANAPPVLGAAVVPPAPGGDVARRGRRRGVTIALVALPLLAVGGIVGVLFATGTWALSSGAEPLAPPTTPSEPPAPAATMSSPPAAPLPAPAPADIPPLEGIAVPASSRRPLPQGRPQPASVPDAGVAPFSIPGVFPAALPSFPGMPPLPSGFPTALPSGFPTALPSGFPTALPSWPAFPQPSPASTGK